MAIKFTSRNSTYTNVGTMLSVASGSKLSIFMKCNQCKAHSELPQNSSIKCPKCGSNHAERFDILENTPDWFRAKIG